MQNVSSKAWWWSGGPGQPGLTRFSTMPIVPPVSLAARAIRETISGAGSSGDSSVVV
jgi:hypothetical protein